MKFARRHRLTDFSVRHAVWLAAFTAVNLAVPVQAATVSWLVGDGNWTDAHWDTAGYPNSATADVRIDNGDPGISNVTLNTAATVGTLDISSDDALTIVEGQSLTVAGGTITNNGSLKLSATNVFSRLSLAADTLLTGSGQTMLGGGTNSFLHTIDSSDTTIRTLTIDSGHTLSGGGQLGLQNGALKVINEGLVRADNGTLYISVIDTGGAGFDNSSGLIEVTNGNTLSMLKGTIAGGTFQGFGTGTLGGLPSGLGIYKDGNRTAIGR